MKKVIFSLLLVFSLSFLAFSLPEGYDSKKYEDLSMGEKTGLMISIRKHFLKQTILNTSEIQDFQKRVKPIINADIYTLSLPSALTDRFYSIMQKAQREGNEDKVVEGLVYINAWLAVLFEYAVENTPEKTNFVYIKKTPSTKEAYVIKKSALKEFNDELTKLIKETTDLKNPEFEEQVKDIVFKLVKNIVKIK